MWFSIKLFINNSFPGTRSSVISQ